MDEAYMQNSESLREVLLDLFRTGVAAAAPGPALAGVLEHQAPSVDAGRVWIVALGKAARPMAETAVAHLAGLGLTPAGGVAVVPAPDDSPVAGLTTVAGDHPFPGPGSMAAAETIGEMAGRVGAGDEVWVLLSGGATSLAAAPVAGLAAEDLQGLYRSLLSSGLDIAQMNTVRKRFSRWGAGRLAVALQPARVRTFIVSDVIGDDLAAIGSGPCVPDPLSAAEVMALLEDNGLDRVAPPAALNYLRRSDPSLETPKPGHPAFRSTECHIVAGNRPSLEAIARRAEELGWQTKVLPEPLSGEAADAGRDLALSLLEQPPGTCLVAGGETVVRVDPGNTGLGGRSQELALAAAGVLAGSSSVLLAAGTDGRDGPTDAAGAVVDGTTWDRIKSAGREPSEDLTVHNSNPSLAAAGALVVTGLTGTNVMDVVIGVVPRT
jgi:glycerate 2-kinase